MALPGEALSNFIACAAVTVRCAIRLRAADAMSGTGLRATLHVLPAYELAMRTPVPPYHMCCRPMDELCNVRYRHIIRALAL
eukprot:1882192-Rhodomonas_salina.3